MSVAHTKAQVYARTKTQTRRAGWTFLTAGTTVELCEKVMGRRHGQPLVRICKVLILSVRRERLDQITTEDVAAEGFPEWTVHQFIGFFCDAMGGAPDQQVTRIEWAYLDDEDVAS